MNQGQNFARAKFAPKGAKAWTLAGSRQADQDLGMAIPIGPGGRSGESRLKSLVRGQIAPRPQAPPPAAPQPAAPQMGNRQAPSRQATAPTIRILWSDANGEDYEQDVELPLPPGSRIKEIHDLS